MTMYQKSVYLLIINATMILRSIGGTLKRNHNPRTLREFKIELFEKLEVLVNLMENNQLTENELLNSIIELANNFEISIGQSQKAINVILKYHYHLHLFENLHIKEILHCPIDSKILEVLGIQGLTLNIIDKEKYLEIQSMIGEQVQYKLDFDSHWDEQHLGEEGLL